MKPLTAKLIAKSKKQPEAVIVADEENTSAKDGVRSVRKPVKVSA